MPRCIFGEPEYIPLTLKEIILEAIRDAVKRNNGNKTRAARDLMCSVRTIRNHLNGRSPKKVGTHVVLGSRGNKNP